MSDFKQLTAYTNVKCKCVAPTLPPFDLLAKCDWHGDELRVELPQWPEAVNVWVNGKAMPYVPVVNDSKCDTCEAMLDCDECLRADASHKELRGLQAENDNLRELVRAAWRCIHTGASCYDCRLIAGGCTLQTAMRELGVEVNE